MSGATQPRLIVHNGRVQWFVAQCGSRWKVFYKVAGQPMRAQGGQYLSESDAEAAAYRYAQD